MPRHVTHPRRDALTAVFDRALIRADRHTCRNQATTRANRAVWDREAHRSGQGG